MIFKLIHKQYKDIEYVFKPGFTQEEIGPFGVNQHNFERFGRDMQQVSIRMSPYYDMDSDPRFKNDPVLKEAVEKFLIMHPKNGIDFQVYNPDDEKTEITIGELNDLKARIAQRELELANLRSGKTKS